MNLSAADLTPPHLDLSPTVPLLFWANLISALPLLHPHPHSPSAQVNAEH